MELATILNRLDEIKESATAGVKTASVTTPASPAPDTLRDALRAAVATEKTAAAVAPALQEPVGDLMKFAEDLSNAEDEANMKKAQVYGAAMCDGFMERFASYEDAAMQVAPAPETKVAAAPTPPQTADDALTQIKTAAASPEFTKFASENPELVKEAFDLGYQQTYTGLVKQAEADYEQGYTDTMHEIHKVASECYGRGVQTINDVLQQVAA